MYSAILATFTTSIQAEFNVWNYNQQNMNIYVVYLSNTKHLKLFLNNPHANTKYKTFTNIEKNLPSCSRINFAMNAGMFHANYEPVGLYIERESELIALDMQKEGWGNFFIQPNGIFAWNTHHAKILTIDAFLQEHRKYRYATQSRPMLVIDGKINPNFIRCSASLKTRNAVGISDEGVFFAISHQKINFYDFANFFKTILKVKNALYLDGSISAAMIPKLNRYEQHRYLGPILADIDEKGCD